MIKVNVPLLMSAFAEIRVFSLPEMNAGTAYLFEMVYRKSSAGSMIHLSELDYCRFDIDDIRNLASLHNDVFENNNIKINHIMNMLERTEPVCVTVNFV